MLGPLLFIIYISDLESGIRREVCKFADDTKVGKVIRRDQDARELQGDLDGLGYMIGQGNGRWNLILESVVH